LYGLRGGAPSASKWTAGCASSFWISDQPPGHEQLSPASPYPAALGLFIYGLRAIALSFASYGLVGLAISTSAEKLSSADRYVLMLFPVFWILALLGRSRWFDTGYRTISPAVMASIAVMAWLGRWLP
jgi:hypothetical protein